MTPTASRAMASAAWPLTKKNRPGAGNTEAVENER
jgi:hypothetical protein